MPSCFGSRCDSSGGRVEKVKAHSMQTSWASVRIPRRRQQQRLSRLRGFQVSWKRPSCERRKLHHHCRHLSTNTDMLYGSLARLSVGISDKSCSLHRLSRLRQRHHGKAFPHLQSGQDGRHHCFCACLLD
ncbi:uncharacterized protein Tco025E_06345 [Trypanosoma conorhini]|uniref:Uncharacterized protein n=1 Tax=Trypanosoma conorhini TaxID=83891 RepID=A0A3R7MDL0_9TRYP|nr:uncharacterized protein Tco025E_06345 [Trypanosoma conorhini]RNF13315.1 hypothetical protein Tco025E_06345 [Trypanosoma conorhini]